jgi:predicted lipopolysaccharide heptosyltransferase III
VQNIFVIKLRYIGDVLLATPVLQSLRAAWPQARLTVAVNPGTQDILAHNPHVDQVLVVERTGWRQGLKLCSDIRRRRFDCVIDLSDSDRSAIMALATGASTRVGFNWEHRWRGMAFTTIVDAVYGSMPMVEYDLCALAPLGVPPATTRPVMWTGPQDEAEAGQLLQTTGLAGRPWVMVHPGARYWFKSWAAERFASLIDHCMMRGLSVAVVGGPGDQEQAGRIAGLCARPPVNLAGRTSLLGLAALMKHCALFIGNDAGPMHMAAAMGAPVVGLFGPSDPSVWGPRGAQIEVIFKGLDCRRCFHPTCTRGAESCMNLISVDEVFDATERFLSLKPQTSNLQPVRS